MAECRRLLITETEPAPHKRRNERGETLTWKACISRERNKTQLMKNPVNWLLWMGCDRGLASVKQNLYTFVFSTNYNTSPIAGQDICPLTWGETLYGRWGHWFPLYIYI
jgi:hypothetical protein